MNVTNWNRNPVIHDASLVDFTVGKNPSNGCIRGNGRSYGDASLDQSMISMLSYTKKLSIENEILTVSSGFTLETVLNCCIQNGCLFPVIPGTRHVSIGGMVAADVHGKNHETHGTIGRWIRKITLQLADQQIISCSTTENRTLFSATIGGMGLTGIILEVEIQLEKLIGTQLTQTSTSCASMSDLLNQLDQSKSAFKVGWCDLLNHRKPWLTETDFIPSNTIDPDFLLKKHVISIPNLPWSVMRPMILKWYNRRHEKQLKRIPKKTIELDACFFPLDRIHHWNRLFGKAGFYQYQCILPHENCAQVVQLLLDKIQSSSFKPWLTVIKKHGDLQSLGMLSFPIHGFSFAFDFPNQRGIIDFFHELDELVTETGGRIYLAKDAVLQEHHFSQMYPTSVEFKSIIHTVNRGHFSSLLAKRLLLVSE